MNLFEMNLFENKQHKVKPIMKFSTFLPLLLLLVASKGVAQENRWVYIGNTASDSSVYYYDRTTIATTGDTRQVWIEELLVNSRLLAGELHDRVVMLWQIDCRAARRRNILSAVYYLKSKTAFSLEAETGWRHMPPGSIGEIIITTICQLPR